MIFSEREVLLKDGRTALLRSPGKEDAAALVDLVVQMCGETEFILNYPEEFAQRYPVDREAEFLESQREDPYVCLILAEVDGRPAGNCGVSYRPLLKVRHRGAVSISVLREYWGLGLGTALFEAMIDVANGWGLAQLELEFVEGNVRARALYEKMGFAITGVKPDAIRLKDGTLLREYSMVKKL